MADEQDRLLPIANVGRIMKQILPPSAKISKEAKERIQECVSEFICFVTGEASDKCHKENRKTVNGDDLCWALSSLGFDNYAEAITKYLYKYREFEKERANQNKATSVEDKDEAPRFDKGVQPGKEIDTTPAASLQFRVLERGQTSLAKPT
ncbi:hypothetical protein RJ640_024770 [Escallonia rubra]|uniref:Transcription factor CBF/NF-Y/archaeal histone domain-containing protein n=1 Tax=Escallonia rubra TaxID=112253 RepID=A0AA88QRQ9_9ASTE|nr:hypothetical protein RJ640_024770 [Escallonia rubra]